MTALAPAAIITRFADWHRVTCAAFADGARARTEVLWLNPAAAAALNQSAPMSLFDEAAQ